MLALVVDSKNRIGYHGLAWKYLLELLTIGTFSQIFACVDNVPFPSSLPCKLLHKYTLLITVKFNIQENSPKLSNNVDF